MPWVCGPKCPFYDPEPAEGSEYDGLCAKPCEGGPYLVNEGEECDWPLEEWEREHALLGRAIAARRAEEGP